MPTLWYLQPGSLPCHQMMFGWLKMVSHGTSMDMHHGQSEHIMVRKSSKTGYGSLAGLRCRTMFGWVVYKLMPLVNLVSDWSGNKSYSRMRLHGHQGAFSFRIASIKLGIHSRADDITCSGPRFVLFRFTELHQIQWSMTQMQQTLGSCSFWVGLRFLQKTSLAKPMEPELAMMYGRRLTVFLGTKLCLPLVNSCLGLAVHSIAAYRCRKLLEIIQAR